MKEFEAKKKYYVHEFKAIQDWFGNRGIAVQEGDLDEWCYDGHFFYYTCKENGPSEITAAERGDVVVCVTASICYECDHELSYEESPFFKRIK